MTLYSILQAYSHAQSDVKRVTFTLLWPVVQTLTKAVCLLSVPYYCAQGDPVLQAGACAFNPEEIDIDELVTHTNRFETLGDIDATSNMLNSRVFILNGLLDTTVDPGRRLPYLRQDSPIRTTCTYRHGVQQRLW